MRFELKRGHSMVILLAVILLAAGLTGCTGEVSAGMDGTAAPQQTAAADTVPRPEGWSSHRDSG